MSRTKIVMMTIVMCVVLACAGCEEGQVTPNAMQVLAVKVETLTTKVDGYQKEVGDFVSLMDEDDLISDETVEKIEKIGEEIDRVQPQITAITKAVAEAEYSGGDDLTTILEAVRAGNAASGPFNPYAVPIEMGLGLVVAVLGMFAKKKSTEATEFKAKYTAHKIGVEKTMKEVSSADAPEIRNVETKLYDNIGEARKAVGVK